MLERVSSAECAAHIVLRCFEAPVRSYRTLGPSFWSHGREQIDIPPWWPAYLESVRSKNHVTSCKPRFRSTPANGSITSRARNSKAAQSSTRTFSNSLARVQTATAPSTHDDGAEDRNHDRQIKPSSQQEAFRETRAMRDPLAKEKHRRRVVEPNENEVQLDRAWNDFTRSGCNQREASWLLVRLAAGDRHIDLERALQTFSYIPIDRRTAAEYDKAVDVSVRLDRYSVAIQIIKEAISRKMGQETLVRFLALCVSKSLWNTAGELWRAVGRLRDPASWNVPQTSASKKRNFAGRYMHHFDVVADLPAKLTTLAARLKSNDPVLLSQKHDLIDLCKCLALTAVESDTVMGLVTEKGILGIFALEVELNFNSGLHLAALASINRMSDKGTKSQLAMLIYDDLRLNKLNPFVPKWALRALIGICSASRHSPQIYRSLLADYQAIYGTPEKEIYLQVLVACANQAEVDHVYAVFEDFRTRGGPKTADDVNSLIRVHAVIGHHVQAQVQFDHVFTKYGFQPSTKNWNTLLLAYSRSNSPEKTYDKFQEMQQSRVRPDEFSWSIMVGVAAQRGDTELASIWVKKAKEAGILPPPAMTGALVDAYLLSNKHQEAESLVAEATQMSREAVQSYVRLWNSLFRYHAFKANSEAILRIQRRMKEYGVKADSMTYAALMTALVIQGRTSDAAQIIRTLHFSHTLSANEFHYSILIHGFAMEKKHDLATLIYQDMLRRFPRATPSARLSMLHLQARREENKARMSYLSGDEYLRPDFRPILRSISEFTAATDFSDRASSIPNPGFGRRSSRSDIENVYFDSLLAFLRRNEDHTASRKILEILGKEGGSVAPNAPSVSPSQVSTLRRQSHELEIAVDSKDWTAVMRIWDQIYQDAINQYSSMHKEQYVSINASNDQPKNLELVGSTGSEFSSMVFQPFANTTPSPSGQPILPAHRYALSRPLSLYIKALDQQQKYTTLMETIKTIHNCGFRLSSKNWNNFVQALCKSSSVDHWVAAYDIFERHLLPRAPSWEVIRRGQWVNPPDERPRHFWDRVHDRRDNRKSRKFLEKLDPGVLAPSYFTMVHLAIVWLKASRLSSKGDHAARRRLENQTPGTVRLALGTPYLKDRVQGVLLRGRKVIGDYTERPRQSPDNLNFAGVQGSQLLIDHLSSDALAGIEELASANQHITKDQLSEAETIAGEIDRSHIVLPSKGRMESPIENRNRVNQAKLRKLRLLQQHVEEMRQTFRSTSTMIGTAARGQPAVMPTSITARQNSNGVDERGFVSSSDSPTQLDGTKAEPVSEKHSALYRIGQILRKFSKGSLHKPSTTIARRQGRIIRTSALARRRYLRLTSSPGNRYRYFVAESLHRSKVRARRLQKDKDTDTSANSLQLEGERASPLPRATKAYVKYLEYLVNTYGEQHKLRSAQASDSNFVRRRLAKRLKWYKYNAQRALGKLRSVRSQLNKAKAGNQQRQ